MAKKKDSFSKSDLDGFYAEFEERRKKRLEQYKRVKAVSDRIKKKFRANRQKYLMGGVSVSSTRPMW